MARLIQTVGKNDHIKNRFLPITYKIVFIDLDEVQIRPNFLVRGKGTIKRGIKFDISLPLILFLELPRRG